MGYPTRNLLLVKSDEFAQTAAVVLAANGVQVHLWPRLNPVPTISFATRYLKISAGLMITATHNPSIYNRYKVYGADGCQITTEAAAEILAEIEGVDLFQDVQKVDYDEAVTSGRITYISDEVLAAYIQEVKNQSVLFGEKVNKNVAITPSIK
ncbi:hypothetical protein [Proteiniclasticum sp. QWL-01]|uniref:hypothetical protein n=1 Tax=Proteiniclasticum sp. QWL-01 TaxID=3036945 RepID=UPI00241144F4|nr:hypothetical protein [Proteiniclasticum sp. QWL-01]WFF74424.1 hypothetical protein P6M73_08235 [Proteiniclasticum sp. QWL-01]